MERQVKSKERVAAHGEVFTNPREVNAILDLVKPETERIDSRFLEPACGEGAFLAEILRRKLAVALRESRIPRRKSISLPDYEKKAVIAACSIYGVDILQDNVEICRQRMFDIWNGEYTKVCGRAANDETRRAVRVIFKRNIVCGNALSMRCVDANGQDTDLPIVFSEWSFITGANLQRKDYRFDRLLEEAQAQTGPEQLKLPDVSPAAPPAESELLRQVVTHYRKVQDDDETNGPGNV